MLHLFPQSSRSDRLNLRACRTLQQGRLAKSALTSCCSDFGHGASVLVWVDLIILPAKLNAAEPRCIGRWDSKKQHQPKRYWCLVRDAGRLRKIIVRACTSDCGKAGGSLREARWKVGVWAFGRRSGWPWPGGGVARGGGVITMWQFDENEMMVSTSRRPQICQASRHQFDVASISSTLGHCHARPRLAAAMHHHLNCYLQLAPVSVEKVAALMFYLTMDLQLTGPRTV